VRLHVAFDFDDSERVLIGRLDGKRGPARRSDLREFVQHCVQAELAGGAEQWRDAFGFDPERDEYRE
jgi:hypothetical protein